MRLKIAAAAALIAVGLGAVGFVLFASGPGSTQNGQFLTAQATRTTVVQQSVANGNLAAATTYGLAFGQDPQLVLGSSTTSNSSGSNSSTSSTGGGSITWPVRAVNVKVGASVKVGDVLASADAGDATLQLVAAQANLAAAQAKLATDQAGATATDRAAANLSIQQARLQLSNATQNYADTKAQNALAVKQAESALARAKQQLTDDGTAGAPADVIAADEAAVTTTQQQLASTQTKATASNHQAGNSVSSATLSVTSARNAYATKTAPAPGATIAADRASVAGAESSAAAAQFVVDHATLVAPAAGIVTTVNVVAGYDAPSSNAITLESGPMVVTAAFAESDIPSIEVGQAASVTVTALKMAVAGKVTSINPVAAGTGSSSVVTYQVQVTLDTADPGMRVGMSASVAVTTAQAANVIAVPSIALSGSDGSYTVRVVAANGQAGLAAVQVGLVTSSMAEIQSGLDVGETVVIGSSTQRVGATTGGGGGIGFPLGGGVRGGGGDAGGGGGPQP